METQKRIISVIAVPVLLIAAGIIIYQTISKKWNLDYAIAGTMVFTLAYLFLLEIVIPLKVNWVGTRSEIRSDATYFGLAIVLSALGQLAALSLMLHLHDWFEMETGFWDDLPFFAVFVLANLIGEFIPYWYHRVSHIANQRSWFSMFLWRLHAIHHIPPKMNQLKTNWMHPANMFLNVFTKIFPLQFLGFDKEVIFAVGVTNLVVAYLSHANIQARTGILDYLLATPRVHHFHHSAKLEEAKNYANILPFWDLLFGTYFNNGKAVTKVGVSEEDTAQYPALNRIWKHMQFPFSNKVESEIPAE
jgi:sterol desaturase/sphingolipid hydroxylase (fatty acid hydroxylase superfamily)